MVESMRSTHRLRRIGRLRELPLYQGKKGTMTLARYYSHLLRRSDDIAPTLDEALRDYQRVVDLSNVALGFYN
jgi:hypothetical protein